MANTVLMGVGPGKESHEEFFEMFVNEKRGKWEDGEGKLVPLLFYSKHHTRNTYVFITMALAIQDNPERRGALTSLLVIPIHMAYLASPQDSCWCRQKR
jgi:hypothetical protein